MNPYARRVRRLTRRNFLKAGGGLLAGAYVLGLAGCGEDTGGSGTIRIPDTGASLPDGDVTFRLIDSGDLKVLFWDEFFPAYEEAHSNITTEYDGLPWEELQEVVPLGIRNGTAHDVFALPLDVSGSQARQRGWVAPIDDVVPNFAEWKANFPPFSFFEGVNQFEGKTYAFPITSNKRYLNLLLYGRELMDRAGYDPSSGPSTWEEYRDAAAKMTNTEEQTYGAIFSFAQPPILELQIASLAHSAGAPSVGTSGRIWTNPENGEFSYDSPETLEAIELILAMKSDGSIFPDSNSILAPESWPRLPQGAAGSTFGGPWIVAQWHMEDPEFDFGVAGQPVPGGGDPLPLGYLPSSLANVLWLYSESKLGQVAGDIFAYLGSLQGQKDWASITGGVGDPPSFPEARGAAANYPQGNQALELGESLVLWPDPIVRNPAVGRVFEELRPVTPSFGETIQGIIVGEIDDPRAAMQDLTARSNEELDRAIGAARQKGAEVSRDDWVFPNWDPKQNYTEEDYANL